MDNTGIVYYLTYTKDSVYFVWSHDFRLFIGRVIFLKLRSYIIFQQNTSKNNTNLRISRLFLQMILNLDFINDLTIINLCYKFYYKCQHVIIFLKLLVIYSINKFETNWKLNNKNY